MHERRRRWGVVVGLMAALLLQACGVEQTPKVPVPVQTPRRPFTVGTTDRITATDPAAITDQASAIIAYNVFQRLTSSGANADDKPLDAAKDCLFDAQQVFTCVLNDGLTFSNGHALTSSDVKFSLERAIRLAVPNSSATQLSSIRKIETPDERTIRIFLNRVDNQIWFALASPAASIVDEEIYDPDQSRAVTDPVYGSGPFMINFFSDEELQLGRNPSYRGPTGAGVGGLTLKSYDSSSAVETAMAEHKVDVVWRGLSEAAQLRYANQVASRPEQNTDDGFGRLVLPGARVQELWWQPPSPNRANGDLRRAVSSALQEDRVSTSLVPLGLGAHVEAFDVGPAKDPKITWKQRIGLTLAYDPTVPDAADLANQIRGRLEDTGGLSVRLVKATPATSAESDLALVDRKAWSTTPLAWLQPYLDDPVQRSKVRQAENTYRATGVADAAAATAAITDLQERAATDLVILPITQSDEYVYLDAETRWSTSALAPGGHLALWGFTEE
ncbi:MAG: ABC transporter substrate-binding protein [Propionibacteriales bacterium]|nr:ABC transporter substrate-binding protein [Propionibacteriales bacterium]